LLSVILDPGDVHVWKIALDRPDGVTGSLRGLLSPDELARADRFRVERGRERYIVGRGVLRTLLSRYTGVPAQTLEFAYNGFGKPELAGSDVCFNLSHSHGIALAAVTRGRAIGVDIERIREEVMRERIAERFFSPAEARALAALPPGQQAQAFFNCWTRKEAWIKARGQGLSIALDSFEVTLAPGEPARLVATRPDADEAGRWSLRALECEPGFAAALAVAGQFGDVHLGQFGDVHLCPQLSQSPGTLQPDASLKLNQAAKAIEIEDIGARVTELEAAAESAAQRR
jgi:4'-phosphopantetheinyl transferase